LSCLVLTLATGWGVVGASDFHIEQKHSLPRPQSFSKESAQPKIANDIQTAAIPPKPPTDQPQPAAPAPVPEPQINMWQGQVDQIPAAPYQIPVLTSVPTDKPVIFLGIDDGLVKSAEAKNWLVRHHLPFTLFLVDDLVKTDYPYFRELQVAGMSIQDHTITHTDLATLPLEQQKAEICGSADSFEVAFGTRPTLFRPPYGSYNELTRQAAAECGMKAIIIWHAKANGGSIQFQDGNTHFLPGDIVLMHFRPEFMQDMRAFVDQAAKDNMQIGRLEDWIQ
jgi:peptidoglycan/xylan/chitin deacetylase (PgdA/CDA1 family)